MYQSLISKINLRIKIIISLVTQEYELFLLVIILRLPVGKKRLSTLSQSRVAYNVSSNIQMLGTCFQTILIYFLLSRAQV